MKLLKSLKFAQLNLHELTGTEICYADLIPTNAAKSLGRTTCSVFHCLDVSVSQILSVQISESKAFKHISNGENMQQGLEH